jgi:copper(I)-binding protein
MNGALFMVINNHGNAADTLLKVESSSAQMAQTHLTEVDASGVASMKEVQAIEIPARGSVEFKPGSYHVMLMGLGNETQEGSSVTFTLTFRNAGKVVIQAPVKAP